MLNTIFISYRLPDADKNLIHHHGSEICAALLLDPGAPAQTAETYRFCSENSGLPFALSVWIDAPLTPAFTRQLLSFFFMPSYCLFNQQRLLFVTGTSDKLVAAASENILQQAQSQGIDNMVVYNPEPYVPALPLTPENKAGYLFKDSNSFIDYYAQLMKTSQPYNHIFYLDQSQTFADPRQLSAAITAAEDGLATSHPGLYELAVELRRITDNHSVLQKKYEAAENELNNYKSHIEIMRSAHQAKELQDYYNNEYEVLPLWYKRLGHIVKVITGKRHFRSLFSDHTKKYKD